MAFETEFGNFVTEGNAVSAVMGPAFVSKAFGMNVIRTENFPDNTNTIKVPYSGSFTAEIVLESANYTPSANSEMSDGSATITAEKSVHSFNITVEALRFAQRSADFVRLTNEAAAAHARLFDSKLKALFSGLSQVVTATAGLTKDNLLDARYLVESGMDGGFSGKLAGVIGYKGHNEIRKELTSITASAFSNMELLSLLQLKAPSVNPVGEFAGIEIFPTSGLPTTGGDNVQAVFDPLNCFYAGVDMERGFHVEIHNPRKDNGLTYEVTTYTFFKVVEWRDAAGAAVRSDT